MARVNHYFFANVSNQHYVKDCTYFTIRRQVGTDWNWDSFSSYYYSNRAFFVNHAPLFSVAVLAIIPEVVKRGLQQGPRN